VGPRSGLDAVEKEKILAPSGTNLDGTKHEGILYIIPVACCKLTTSIEKPPVAQVRKNLPTFCGTRRFITVKHVTSCNYCRRPCVAETCEQIIILFIFLLVLGWDLRHQVLRPLLAYCTAPDER
jgi:hypothetical protein